MAQEKAEEASHAGSGSHQALSKDAAAGYAGSPAFPRAPCGRFQQNRCLFWEPL